MHLALHSTPRTPGNTPTLTPIRNPLTSPWGDSKGTCYSFLLPLLGGSDGKESACTAGGLGLIPGLGWSPGRGKGYPLQYSCLENSMDREAWWATVHGTAKSQTSEWLSLTAPAGVPIKACLNLSGLLATSTDWGKPRIRVLSLWPGCKWGLGAG